MINSLTKKGEKALKDLDKRKSLKDLDDAKHLRITYSEKINENKINKT